MLKTQICVTRPQSVKAAEDEGDLSHSLPRLRKSRASPIVFMASVGTQLSFKVIVFESRDSLKQN